MFGSDELTAEREDEPIVRNRSLTTLACHHHGLSGQVNSGDVSLRVAHANGAEHVFERDTDSAQVGFVVANADVVEGVPVDEGDFDLGPSAEFLNLAGRPNRAP